MLTKLDEMRSGESGAEWLQRVCPGAEVKTFMGQWFVNADDAQVGHGSSEMEAIKEAAEWHRSGRPKQTPATLEGLLKQSVEIATGYTAMDRDGWLAERRKGVGGSEVGAVLGMGRFSTPFKVALSKLEVLPEETNDDILRGRFLEDGIAKWYEAKTGVDVYKVAAHVHPEFPEVRCSPDRLGALESGLVRLISIKSPRRGLDVLPDEYVLQLQWEFLILSACGYVLDETMHLVSVDWGELVVREIMADRELQRDVMAEVRKWWARTVAVGVLPEPDGSEAALAWTSRMPATEPLRDATQEEEIMMIGLLEARNRKKEMESAEAGFRARLQESVGAARGITSQVGVAKWQASRHGKFLKVTGND